MHPRMYAMFRGSMVTRDAPNDQGHIETPVVKDEPATPEPKEDPVEPPVGSKPSDEEARLLREVMKQKTAAREAKAALDAANANLAKYDGIDVTKVRELLAAQAEAERAEAERRGEYDRIVASMKEQNAAAIAAVETEKQTINERLAAAQRQIDELTIGASFSNSKFLADETVLTPSKARKLYDDHFEIEDGVLTAYDKPRGSKDRTPLVDASGDRLSFETAIEKIVRGDPDFDRIGKSKLKPGAGSITSDVKDEPKKSTAKGVDAIAAALKAARKK